MESKTIAKQPQENFSMIIPVSHGSILEHCERSDIAKKYGVDIKAVLVPIAEEFVRQTGTEISPGSALEVDGKKDKVLILYGDAVAGK